jgi:NACHT domain
MDFGGFDIAALKAAWDAFVQSPTFTAIGAIVTFSFATMSVVTARLEVIQKFVEAFKQLLQVFKTPAAAPVTPMDTLETRSKLLRVLVSEYARRRQDSLHSLVMMDLEFQENPSAIDRPRPLQLAPESMPLVADPEPVDRTLMIAGGAQAIPVQQSLLDVYDQVAIDGKLLILGKPGSGKTTELLKFAISLTEKATADPLQPIPVLLELSTWTEESGTIETWITARLKRLYNVETATARAWLRDEQLVLLLDGLNELGLVRQDRAIVAINAFLRETIYPHCVVCCRSEEYEAGQERLSQLNGAIYLEPLSDGQIQRYLQAVQRSPFWGNIQHQPALRELARSPLLLTMMVTVYQDRQIRNSSELFNLYIDYAFQRMPRRKGLPARPQVTRHLTWLARQLKLQCKPELMIERIQPSWLPSDRDRWWYRVLCGLVIAIFCGTVAWVVFGHLESELQGFMTAVGLAGGLLYGVYSREDLSNWLQKIPMLKVPLLQAIVELLDNEEIEPVRLGWSWHRAKTGLLAGLTAGFVLGSVVFFYDWFMHDFDLGLRWGSALGGSYGCFIAIVSGLQAGVRGSTEPNQGIWESFKNAIVVTLLATPMAMLVAGVGLLIPLGFLNWQLAAWIGVGAGFLSGLFSGGLPCIQHGVLRFLLWRRGVMPWNYARFLEYAHDLRLLQRVGGRYRFMHELLREHFEQL